MDGVVPPKGQPGRECGGFANQSFIDDHDIELRPELLELIGGRVAFGGRHSTQPSGPGQGRGGLDEGQLGADDGVGRFPYAVTGSGAGFVDEQGNDRRRVEEGDHPRCSGRRSLTVPSMCSGSRSVRLLLDAGCTRPSAMSRSSGLGWSTGTMRATGRPWSVTVTVRPDRTAAR